MYLADSSTDQAGSSDETGPYFLNGHNGNDLLPVEALDYPGKFIIEGYAYHEDTHDFGYASRNFELQYCPTIVSFDLYDGTNHPQKKILTGSINEGDQIPVCVDNVSIEALGNGFDKVLMKLYDESGELLVKNLETTEPWTLGKCKGPDYFPVPALTVGKFKICAKPMTDAGESGN